MRTHNQFKSVAYISMFALVCISPSALSAEFINKPTSNNDDARKAETAQTSPEKLKSLQDRYNTAFAEFSTKIGDLSKNPALLGTKELFEIVDQTDREMKSIRSGCSSLLNSLQTESKAIKKSSYFSEDQKNELVESSESQIKECFTLSNMLDLAIQRLSEAYKCFPKWNRIHNTFRNLQGKDRASEVIKENVDQYIGSFSPEPKKVEGEPPSDDTKSE